MPQPLIKVEGSGNGIKTLILNMSEIAKALHLEPTFLTKFLGMELGAQSKLKSGKTCIINGSHNVGDLTKKVAKFIEMFVLCPNCKLPESTLEAFNKTIRTKCNACGHNDVLNVTHKIRGYIIDTYKCAPVVEVTQVRLNQDSHLDVDDVVNWTTDANPEAVAQRKLEEMSIGVSAWDCFSSKYRQLDSASQKLEALNLAQSFTEAQLCSLVLDCIVGDSCKSLSVALADNKQLLQLFIPANNIRVNAFIDAIEILMFAKADLRSQLVRVFQLLYDFEVLDEASILNWNKSITRSGIGKEASLTIREVAHPFIDWLQNAQEEE
jgi:translation initiation factor 5